MAQNNNIDRLHSGLLQGMFRIVSIAWLLLAFSSSESCDAQSTAIPPEGTPWQRWLPPPRSLTAQHEAQARLLSRLRDALNTEPSKDANLPRLSDADVQSLKEAMKHFGGNLPDGLSPDVLDSIPPELISKALSNPELMRQAKEMAEQYLEKERPKSGSKQESPANPPISKSQENTSTEPKKQTQPAGGAERPTPPRRPTPAEGTKPTSKATDGLIPETAIETAPKSKPKEDNFNELMNKLLKTQEQFEKSKKDPVATTKETEFNDFNPLLLNNPDEFQGQQTNTAPGERPQPNPVPSQSSQSNKAKPQSASPSARTPTPATRPSPGSGRESQQSASGTESTSSNARNNDGNNLSNRSKTIDSNPLDSKDVRKELDRRGLGPTLQKFIEDARVKVANRPKQNGSQASESPTNETKTPGEKNSLEDGLNSANRSSIAPNASKGTDFSAKPTIARPPLPETDFSKGVKKAGDYLSNLWTQISKSSSAAPSARSTSASPTTDSSASDALNLPNPLNADFFPYLVAIAILGFAAFLALKHRVRSEQVRNEMLLAQLAPSIDEIRTREDLVHAFHLLAKQRFQAAQAWWTCGYVAKQFDTKLPQYKSPMQTLATLYDQARYYPMEHQLSAQQIDEAKIALKQCKG